MSKLSADDRGLLQQIQEGLTGVKPIDDAWITMIIDALKKKPEVFKTLFKGKGAMFGECSALNLSHLLLTFCQVECQTNK